MIIYILLLEVGLILMIINMLINGIHLKILVLYHVVVIMQDL